MKRDSHICLHDNDNTFTIAGVRCLCTEVFDGYIDGKSYGRWR